MTSTSNSAPIDCASAMRELWDYLDDELPVERSEQIRAHLATCEGCRDHVNFCRAFLRRIDTAPVRSDDVARLRDRVATALRADGLTAPG